LPTLRAQVEAVQPQHIEGIQEHIGRPLPAKHGAHAVEIGDPIRSADHAPAVEDHRADRQRSQGGSDRRKLRTPLLPIRENTRTRSPSRWQMKRKPSCLIS
jgi:hypothetical protein